MRVPAPPQNSTKPSKMPLACRSCSVNVKDWNLYRGINLYRGNLCINIRHLLKHFVLCLLLLSDIASGGGKDKVALKIKMDNYRELILASK